MSRRRSAISRDKRKDFPFMCRHVARWPYQWGKRRSGQTMTDRTKYQKAPKIENGICNEMLTLKTMHNNVAVLAVDQLSVST